MSWRRLTIVVTFLCLAVAASATKQHHSARKAKAKAPVVQPQPQVPQQEAPPQPPPTPEHGPSSPPDVSFQSGQLTIVARNSTLGDVLNAVRSKTGASVEMPAPSGERVVGQFGPGAPRDVMAQLLNGSHFDYVLLGSPSDPGALKRVVLTAKASGSMPAQQQPNNPSAVYNPGVQPAPPMEADQQEQPTEDANTDAQPEPPPQAEQEEPQGEQPQQPNPGGGPMVKTPEQLLRELQQQQQQQQGGQPPQQ